MNRRDAGHALLLGLLAVGVSPLTHAQQKGKVYRIGYLGAPSRKSVEKALEAFLRALRELGWIAGQNLIIEFRWADGIRTHDQSENREGTGIHDPADDAGARGRRHQLTSRGESGASPISGVGDVTGNDRQPGAQPEGSGHVQSSFSIGAARGLA